MSSPSDRLRDVVRVAYRNNISALARALGVLPQALTPYLNGKSKIGDVMRGRLLSCGIDPKYIDYGGCPMFLSNNVGRNLAAISKLVSNIKEVYYSPGLPGSVDATPLYTPQENEAKLKSVASVDAVELPAVMLGESVGAGYNPSAGNGVNKINFMDIISPNSNDLCVGEVVGNSMAHADIKPGDFVIIDREAVVKNYDIVVVYINGDLLIKRYVERAGRKYLTSESSDYFPIELREGDNIKVVGVVDNILKRVKKRRNKLP